jgi:hypothetical protein
MPITIDGSGTITGLSAGGLPDSSITTADISNAAETARQAIREKYAAIQTQIDAATTPDEIKVALGI